MFFEAIGFVIWVCGAILSVLIGIGIIGLSLIINPWLIIIGAPLGLFIMYVLIAVVWEISTEVSNIG